MTRAHDFVVDLAKAGKSFREIQDMVSTVYSDKSLKKTAIYDIMKKVKEGKNTEDLSWQASRWLLVTSERSGADC